MQCHAIGPGVSQIEVALPYLHPNAGLRDVMRSLTNLKTRRGRRQSIQHSAFQKRFFLACVSLEQNCTHGEKDIMLNKYYVFIFLQATSKSFTDHFPVLRNFSNKQVREHSQIPDTKHISTRKGTETVNSDLCLV